MCGPTILVDPPIDSSIHRSIDLSIDPPI